MDVHARIEAAQNAAWFIRPAAPSFDRLPALQAVFEKVAGACAAELAGMSSSPTGPSVASVGPSAPGSAEDPLPLGAVAATIAAEGWGETILIALDRACVWLLTESMFGGDGSEPAPAEDRPYSPTEMQVARAVAGALARTLDAAFEPLPAPVLRLERIEAVTEKLRERPHGIVARFAVEALGRSAAVTVCIPPTALAALKDSLPEERPAEEAHVDPRWTVLMEEGVRRTHVTVRAVLEERLTLGAIARLRVGQILPLQSTPNTRARAECNGQQLFWCEIGQAGGAYTIRIDEPVTPGKESVNAVPHH
jgi:flagellar motor switch protein FliM